MTWQIMGTAHLGVPDIGRARCVCHTSPKGQDACPLHQAPVVVPVVATTQDTATAEVTGPTPADMPTQLSGRGCECPTPEKQPYRSQARALRAQRGLRLPAGRKDRLHPYLCPSRQHWHLTHQTPDEQAAVAQRIRRHTGRAPTTHTVPTPLEPNRTEVH